VLDGEMAPRAESEHETVTATRAT